VKTPALTAPGGRGSKKSLISQRGFDRFFTVFTQTLTVGVR
jgi:hypothetical protein